MKPSKCQRLLALTLLVAASASAKTITVNTNTFAGNGANTKGIAFGGKIGSAYVLPQNMQNIATKYTGVSSKVFFPVKP